MTMPTTADLITANAQLGSMMVEALVILRRWIEWQGQVKDFAPDGLLDETLAFIATGRPKELQPNCIVAEITKNWVEGQSSDPLLIGQKFEHVIEVNRGRGYHLRSYKLLQKQTGARALMETIIAVFEREIPKGPEPVP